MEREVVVDFAAGWNKHIVNTSSAICKPVRSSDKGLCMHQRAGEWHFQQHLMLLQYIVEWLRY